MKIVWSGQARRDLHSIFDFIARDSARNAKLQVERLISCVERTAGMPSKGHPVHELPSGDLREVHEGSYRIIYGVQDDQFYIVAIVHMKRRVNRRWLG